MARILWIGDAGTTTGFGRVAEEIGGRLVSDFGHEVHALAVMWKAAYPYDGPLKLYRADAGGNFLGYDRTPELLEALEPDLVICNEDVPQLIQRLEKNRFDPGMALLKKQPVIGYVPVDGYNVPPSWTELNGKITLIAYTEFGAKALGIDRWIHHAVDTTIWQPVDEEHPLDLGDGIILRSRAACRELFNIPQDAFVVGRVDTNTGRKDWGSTWKVMNEAFRMGLDPDNTVALWHTKIKNPGSGADLEALITKGDGMFMVTNGDGWQVERLVALVNCFNVGLSTSRGEGWGLTGAEISACGIPVIATDCSSNPEVLGPGAVLVPGKAYMTNPYGVDQVLADVTAMAGQLVLLQKNPDRRAEIGAAGIAHQKTFSWDSSAAEIHAYIEALVAARQSGGPQTEA